MRLFRTLYFKKITLAVHRDVGYFLTGLVVIYCLSGLALNHLDEWNPDFSITKKEIDVPAVLLIQPIDSEAVTSIAAIAGEDKYTLFDRPTPSHLKIYFDHATLLVDLRNRRGFYEKLERRHLIFEANILHRNSIRSWKWAADILAVLLITVNITGLMIVRGKNGFFGRGKWFFFAGLFPPVAAVIFFHFFQQ